MRNIILGLAVSLDGYIEGPNGEYDWCMTDQDYGMKEFLSQIDAIFIGRKTYEMSGGGGSGGGPFAKYRKYVFSNTLEKAGKGLELITGDLKSNVAAIKNQEGKDIWLFGGAGLTTSLMNEGLVDKLFLAVHPILLGGGKPLFSDINERKHLTLTQTKSYNTGLVSLYYDVKH